MVATSVIFTVLIASVVLLITAAINYAIAKNNGLNATKWFLKGLIFPFISIIFLQQEVTRRQKKRKDLEKRQKTKIEESTSHIGEDEDLPLKNAASRVGLTIEELETRKNRKQALLDDIKRKHLPKVENLDIKTNEDLMNFMNGPWLYENPKNISIFQVFIFNDNTLKVDASFSRFAVSKKEISYTVTLMGNYLRVQGKPQKILITGRKEVLIGNRRLVKMTKNDHKQLEDLLFTIGSDAELLFGEAVKANEYKKTSVA